MTTATGSTTDDRSLEDVMRHQMDRLDEMQKLDGDVIGLNSAYIDILDRITNKLDLLATLADEIETDTRAHPDSMDDTLKRRFDLLSQSALMNRYMCTKALFQNALGSIQAMNQFGSDYLSNVRVPFDPSTSESTENDSQARHSDVSADTIASDSDATVAARLDDSNVSVMDEEAVGIMDSSNFVPPQSIHAPSTLQLEEEDMEMIDAREGGENVRDDENRDDELAEEVHVNIIKDATETVTVITESEREYDRDCDGPHSVAHSVKSVESIEYLEQKTRKKKKKKRSKSSDQRRRNREAEKMENILNKHLKRSRETKTKKTTEVSQKDGPRISSPHVKDIEVVTLSDDDLIKPAKMSRIDDDETVGNTFNPRVIPGPKTPPMEDYENYCMERDARRDIKSEIEKTTSSISGHVLATIIDPPNACPLNPNPLISPILPTSLGRGPGFIAATMKEAPPTLNWSQLNGEKETTTCHTELSISEKPVMIEEQESIIGGEEKEKDDKKKETTTRKDSRCDSRGSLKERLEEEIRLRESGQFSPERRGRSRSLSYSPRRDRSRSRSRGRSRSRSRDRDRRDWRSPWTSSRYTYGYRQRYRRWSRSRTRSRSLSRSRYRSVSRDRERDYTRRSRSRDRDDYRRSRSRSRYRSTSRDRNDDSRYRSISRSRSRSWSRSRSVSRERSITPLTPDGREVNSPIPRAYARFRNRSSERKEKKKEDKNDEKENEKNDGMIIEGKVPSPNMEAIDRTVTISSSPSIPSSSVLVPTTSPPINSSFIVQSTPSPRPHSTSSSPSTFIPPPPIVIPSKPPPLKISIPTNIPIPISNATDGSSSNLSTAVSLSSTSIVKDTSNNNLPRPSIDDEEKRNESAKRTVLSSSDMSLEGNTISDGSNERTKSVKSGEEVILDIPTPPLSNPSSMEQKKWSEIDELNGVHAPLPPLPPPPSLPPLPPFPQPSIHNNDTSHTNASRVPTTLTPSMCTPNTPQSVTGGIRSGSGRAFSGPYPLHSFQPQQFYSNSTPHNPYGPQNGWMNGESQWQQYYHHYNQDPGMMGYGCPPPTLHPSSVAQGPVSDAHGSFMKAMRVIPSPINPPPDWAQMAREHANQQIHVANVPPPPPLLGQQGHMMGHHHHYGSPQAGRGGSRFRGGGGKGRRW